MVKAAKDVTYVRMNVMHDKAYKVLHVRGDEDTILRLAACNNHVVDILTY